MPGWKREKDGQVFDFSENEPDFSPDDVIRNGISEVAVITQRSKDGALGVLRPAQMVLTVLSLLDEPW